MKLLVDMNLSPRWVGVLNAAGFVAAHWSTLGAHIRAESVSPAAIGEQVVIALRQMAAELQAGALLTVDPSRTRLSLLPLRRG